MSKLLLATLMALASAPSFAQGLGAPDANCNPSVDPPSTGGCTWYNFYLIQNGTPTGSPTAGSSFQNYYANAGNPPWVITTTGPTTLRVVDGGHQGDVFAVYDNGVELGQTSPTPIDSNHSCANDPTGIGADPAACWNDPLMSHGTFQLAAGTHSITIDWAQMVPGGNSTLQWFEIGAGTTSSGLPYVGSMPQVASQDDWTTTFTLVNKGAASSQVDLSMFADSGQALVLPLDMLQTSAISTGSLVNQTLAANASLIVQTTGPTTSPLLVGGAQLTGTGALDGFAIFHINSSSQEAVVPMEMRNASSYLLAFDDTNSVVTGVAIENISTQAANVNVIFRNDSGATIGTGSISLPANGHTSFVLSQQYSFTANIRGTAEFDTPLGGQISVLGIRYTPPGTITTIPVLANVGTSGGSIAQIASGGGWLTTFVLVNAGTSDATANLSFFADNGTPVSLPLYSPQTNTTSGPTTTFTSTVTTGSTVVVQTAGSASSPVQIGSAQLTTNGAVSGYVIFRYQPNGQEAVVPLENRNPSAFIIAFDNTANTVTGIAVNNASGVPVNIPVIIRDSSGNQVGTSSIALAANGHSAFTLAQQFSATANIQGTLEFDTPSGASIGVLGLRSPPALTFTTLPSLARQ